MIGEESLPPQSIEFECSVIAAVIHDNAVLDEVASIVAPADFYRAPHQTIVEAMFRLGAAGSPIDLLTLSDELSRANMLGRIGGEEALVDIARAAPHAANAKYHARKVAELATSRKVIEAAQELVRMGFSRTYRAEQLVEHFERLAFSMGGNRGLVDPAAMHDLVDQAIDRIDRRRDGVPDGIATGFAHLDSVVSFQPGQLNVLAARPSMGKSALALNVCENAVLGLGASTLFISLEMSGLQLAERTIASQAPIPASKFKRPKSIVPEEFGKIMDVRDRLSRSGRFWVDSNVGQSASQIMGTARRHKARHGLDFIILDYLQLVEPEKGPHGESRQQQIGQMTRKLKKLARELQIPILALSQLNRKCEDRPDKTPRMSDLRESGDIENDADIVLLLHRPDYYDPEDRPGMAEVVVAKNRDGATETVNLTFRRDLSRFEDYSGGGTP